MRLTLKQMASRLGFTPRTFARYVDELQIPHIVIGKYKRFDAVAVEAFLAVKWPVKGSVARMSPVVRKSAKSRFGEALGL